MKPEELRKALSLTAGAALARRELSSSWLVEKLINRAEKLASDMDRNERLTIINRIREQLEGEGALNDTRFTEINLNAFRRQGRSRYWIRCRLMLRGVSEEIINECFRRVGDNEANELSAARKYVQRCGLARHSTSKALRMLSRQGYSGSLARAALDE